MTRKRIGIVGGGNAAGLATRCATEETGLEIVAICHPDRSKAEKGGRDFKLAPFTNIGTMVRDAKLDSVMILTPSGLHAGPTIEGLEAGVDVLCEKPLEVSAHALDAIFDAQRRTGRKVGCILQNRFATDVVRVMEALEQKRLGEIAGIIGQVPWYRGESYYKERSWRGTWALDGGGALANQAIHQFDLILAFANLMQGNAPDEMPQMGLGGYVANISHQGVIETEDTALVSMQLPKGVVGSLFATTSANPSGPWEIKVCGSKGTVVLTNGKLTQWSVPEAGDAAVAAAGSGNSGASSDPMAVDDSPRINLFRAWAAHLNGEAVFPVSAEVGSVSVRAMLHFYKHTRAPEILPPRKAD